MFAIKLLTSSIDAVSDKMIKIIQNHLEYKQIHVQMDEYSKYLSLVHNFKTKQKVLPCISIALQMGESMNSRMLKI